MNIGDVFFRARLAAEGLVAEATKAGTKAGAAAGSAAGKKVNQSFVSEAKKGVGVGAGFAAFNLVGMAISKVTSFLGDSAQAFREDEVSVQKLTTALRANIEGWDGNTDAIDSAITAGQQLGFSDEDQRSSIAELVAAYGNERDALESLAVARDLARFSGVDLATASDTLIKVHAGNYRALKALGIQTKDIHNETEALAAIQKVAAGQAEDYAQTLSGKLAVADEKAAEASEKFGKSVARLQAVTIPAAADALSGLADKFDALQNAGDDSLPVLDRADALVQDIADSIFFKLIPGSDKLLESWNQQKFAAMGFDEAAFRLSERVEAIADAAKRAASPTADLTSKLDDAKAAAKDLDQAIADLSQTISDELFGKAINEGNLADLRKTHKELFDQREEVKKDGREWKILTGKIAENEQAQFDLQLQMKEKEGPKAVIEWLKKQIDKFGDASGALQTLINKYKEADDLASTLIVPHSVADLLRRQDGGNPKKPGKARGGPVAPWQAYRVGERGEETLVMGARPGYVLPNPMSSSTYAGAGATMSQSIGPITISVDARGATNPHAVGESVGDAVARVLRDQTARLPRSGR